MVNTVFEKSKINTIELNNRIIRSATHEGFGDEKGFPTEKLKKKYIDLAKGEAGLIITGYAGVRKDGKSSYPGMNMIDDDESIDVYKEITQEVHKYNTPIIMQIAHCGRQTRSKLTGYPTVAPSAIRDGLMNEDLPKELTDSEIDEIIDSFVKAVERVKKAGFDGVQLHLAHGYLLSSFLSPHMNKRRDKWGGNTENRFRIVGEIFERSKKIVGDYPILVKINAHEGSKDGTKVEEAVEVAKLLEKAGCAAIEVSCGIFEDGFYSCRGDLPVDALLKYNFRLNGFPEVVKKIIKPFLGVIIKTSKPYFKYNVEYAKQIKENVKIPVIVVGGIGKLEDISEIIDTKKADYVSMCRPFIIEADIVKKFKLGKQTETKCIYCNFCMAGLEEFPLRCYYGRLKS